MTEVHVVVPAGIDEPARASGGNVYDQHLVAGLHDLGWHVRVHAVDGTWPHPDSAARHAFARVLARLPDRSLVVVDGLVASALPAELVPESRRLGLVVLVHLALGDAPGTDAAVRRQEHEVLRAAAAVVTSSRWTRDRLVARGLAPGRLHVAEPGVDPADVAPGTDGGGELLGVAALLPHKGHEVLVDALARVADLPWRCTLAGRLDADPEHARRVAERAGRAGVDARLHWAGPLSRDELAKAYAAADLVVVPSHVETYGMVVTEALARGLPVVGSCVGGLPESLGRTAAGALPGVLVPPGDAAALAEALRCWLTDPAFRRRLRSAAIGRRSGLTGWPETALVVSTVLEQVAS